MDAYNTGYLPIEEFKIYHEMNSLGRLFYPNDKKISSKERNLAFFIELNDLYKNINEATIRQNKNFLSLGLVGIIATGQMLNEPNYDIASQPMSADFFIITQNNPIDEDIIGRTSQSALCEYRDKNIHLTVRGIDQVIAGLRYGINMNTMNIDKASIEAWKNGVPLFFNNQINYIEKLSNVKNNSIFTPQWYSDETKIFAEIERD